MTAVPGARLIADAGVPHPAFRVVFSRDERRSRPPAFPPRFALIEGRRVLMPVDPESGGTWIAATDAGLVFTLLNVTPHVSPGAVSTAPHWPGRVSRGALIPALAGAVGLDDALARIAVIDPRMYAPFHLMVTGSPDRLDVRANGSTLRVHRRRADGPWMRTSSSLGDRRVIGPRRQLFEETFGQRRVERSVQDGFHLHRWASRPAVSVWMARPDARTVSITTVEIAPGRVQMEYLMV